MRAGTDRFNRRLGGSDQFANLRIDDFRTIFQNPQNGAGFVALRGRKHFLGFGVFGLDVALQFVRLKGGSAVSFASSDFFDGQLAVFNRTYAQNIESHVAVGNSLNFKFVKFTEFGNLTKSQGRILNQPYSSSSGH